MASLQNARTPYLDNGQPAWYIQIQNISHVSTNVINKPRLQACLPCSLVCLLHNSNIAYYFLQFCQQSYYWCGMLSNSCIDSDAIINVHTTPLVLKKKASKLRVKLEVEIVQKM